MLCQCRTEDDGEVGKRRKAVADGCFEVLDGCLALVLHEVPFVDTYHESLAVLLDEREDVAVLAFDTASGINHQDTNVGIFDGTDASDNRVVLNILVHLCLLADTGSVHQIEVEAELVVARVDAVACRAGNVRHDVAFFTDKGVDDGRLSCIRASYDGEARNFFQLLFFLFLFREAFHYFVKKVSSSRAVDC